MLEDRLKRINNDANSLFMIYKWVKKSKSKNSLNIQVCVPNRMDM